MSVAKSYAKALFEASSQQGAQEAGLDQIEGELDAFLALVNSSREAKVALMGPAVTSKEKTAIVDEVSKKAGYQPAVKNFLSLLARKGRLPILAEIRSAWTTVRLHAEGGVSGRLVSADPLKPEDVQGLSQAFGKKLGKKVAFQVSTDPSLLAGIKVNVNGITYDGTLRSQLQRLRDRVATGESL
jgi:F-type H+-transporting ATPase subunit delta